VDYWNARLWLTREHAVRSLVEHMFISSSRKTGERDETVWRSLQRVWWAVRDRPIVNSVWGDWFEPVEGRGVTTWAHG
jgi:hypothetical protein